MRQLLRREDCGPVSGRAYAQALKYLQRQVVKELPADCIRYCLKKLHECDILEMKKDNRPQGGLSDKVVFERLPLPVKVLGQFSFVARKA